MFVANQAGSNKSVSQQSPLAPVEEANAIGALDDVIDSAAGVNVGANANSDELIVATPSAPDDSEETECEVKETTQAPPPDPERDAAQRRNRRLTRRQDNRYHSGTRSLLLCLFIVSIESCSLRIF